MNKVLTLFFFTTLMVVSNCYKHLTKRQVLENGDLVFAHVLYRHGDRTIIEPYETDPWKDIKYWPNGWGQLTNVGKNQHYQLGKWLRKRYNGLISKTYSKDEVYIRSTDVDRTLMSALSNLAGLYEPEENSIDEWNKNLKWQPIPVHTMDEGKDSVLAGKKTCPAYDHALKNLLKSDEFKGYNHQFKEVYEYITLHAGKTVNSLQSVQNLYSCLHIEEINNYTLPEWTRNVYPDKMSAISGLAFAVKAYTPQLARLKVGLLLKEILERFQNKTLGGLTPNRSLFIYSGHDTTVANLLNILGVFKIIGFHNPAFRATVLLEMRKTKHDFVVELFYKNSSSEPSQLNIPNCGMSCPLIKMFELYRDVIPVDWEAECRLSLLMTTTDIESSFALFGVVTLIILAACIVLLLSFVTIQRRHYHDRWYMRIDGY